MSDNMPKRLLTEIESENAHLRVRVQVLERANKQLQAEIEAYRRTLEGVGPVVQAAMGPEPCNSPYDLENEERKRRRMGGQGWYMPDEE